MTDAVDADSSGHIYRMKSQLADMVLLSEDLFDMDSEKIREVTVCANVIGGQVVYGELSVS